MTSQTTDKPDDGFHKWLESYEVGDQNKCQLYDIISAAYQARQSEIDRLKRQVEVLQVSLSGVNGRCTPEAQLVVDDALAAADKIAKGE